MFACQVCRTIGLVQPQARAYGLMDQTDKQTDRQTDRRTTTTDNATQTMAINNNRRSFSKHDTNIWPSKQCQAFSLCEYISYKQLSSIQYAANYALFQMIDVLIDWCIVKSNKIGWKYNAAIRRKKVTWHFLPIFFLENNILVWLTVLCFNMAIKL